MHYNGLRRDWIDQGERGGDTIRQFIFLNKAAVRGLYFVYNSFCIGPVMIMDSIHDLEITAAHISAILGS